MRHTTARAYEYVFDMSQALNPENIDKTNKRIAMKQKTSSGKTIYFYITYSEDQATSEALLNQCYIDDKGRLALVMGKTDIAIKITCTDKINQVQFGKMDCLLNGAPNDGDYQFGNEVNGISDFAGIGSTDNYFIAGQSSSGFTMTGPTAGTSFTTSIHYNNDQRTWFIGPQVIVRTEPITLEALTHADHNVKHQYHTIDHDLVGVGVRKLYANDGTTQTFLIARSVLPISNEYKHQMAEGKTLLRDANGNVPSWANPETPQYAWIGLKIDNPEEYVGHQFSGVRGIYVYDDGFAYNLLRYNPVMEVIGTPTIKKDAEGNKIEVGTQLNTYSCANLSEQDQSEFFFMEPRLLEICNVVDIMRSDDQKINVPDRTAILPDGMSENIYVDNNITGHAGITDRSYNMWSKCDMETFGVSQEHEALAQAWRMRNKVYHVDGGLIVASAYQDNAYPLDIPNLTYEDFGSAGIGMHIQGEAKLDQYTEDMWVGNGDYWSRYNFAQNKNAYRNDLKITVYNPTLKFKGIGNLEIQRCDHKGNFLKTVGTIEQNQWVPGTFTVHYADAAKEAVNDEGLKQILTPVYEDGKSYDLEYSTEKIMGLSDMFYSDEMTSREANTALYPGFQYRVVPAEGNNNTNFKCVVSFAPVFKTNENVVSRATYTKEQVDADVDNQLEQRDIASITFTPNMERGMTEYRVYKAKQGATEGGKKWEVALANIQVDDDGFLNPTFTDDIKEDVLNEYVPEVYTAYNNNTYGCYKQVVSDASISIVINDLEAASVAEDGKMPCLATLGIKSAALSDKDSRYLIRVWREVNGVKTLLNVLEEVQGKNEQGTMVTWTNYADLKDLAKADQNVFVTITDVFRVAPVSTVGLMAEGQTVNIPEVKYYATLYVEDVTSSKYYVKKKKVSKSGSIPTAITTVNGGTQVESVRYYNTIGVESSEPFKGVNIVVTRYSDGNTITSKMIR